VTWEDEHEYEPTRVRRRRPRANPRYTDWGERIPPVAKPYKRSGVRWVHGVGWVWNPTDARCLS